jgi:hypothetical protein
VYNYSCPTFIKGENLAKASEKKVEEAARLRYIRVLERFNKSITSYLFKSEEISKETYDRKVDNNARYLDRTPKAALYKGEYSDLEALVQRMIDYRNGDAAIETIKEDLLYRANQLEKSINRRRYKKDKHTASKFKEWE